MSGRTVARPALSKPSYRLTRQAFWVSFVLAWAIIGAIVWGALTGRDGAVQIAPIALPSMVALIVALLGIHRAYGSVDMRTVADSSGPLALMDPRIPPFAGGGQ